MAVKVTRIQRRLGTELLPALALLFMVAAAYLPAFRDRFIWDDDQYVLNQPTLKNITGLRRMWLQINATPQYYPLVFTGFWTEYHLAGLEPTLYHFDNVV